MRGGRRTWGQERLRAGGRGVVRLLLRGWELRRGAVVEQGAGLLKVVSYCLPAGSPDQEERDTSLGSLLRFLYIPVARSWSLDRRCGGSCRCLRRRIVGAWDGLRLRWLLLLFAAAE